MQRVIALAAAIVSAPILLILALLVVIDSPGGPLFVTTRNGAEGRPFRLFKLRTMRRDSAASGHAISVREDSRVTRVGRWLRPSRLDELPQLWNVLKGDMLLVGPRPEDPRYVDLDDPLHHRVFTAKPGITGLAQLAYAAEAELLDPVDPDGHYRAAILPAKLALDERYLDLRSLRLDSWILFQTARTAFGRPPSAAAIASRAGRPQGEEDGAGEA